MPLATLEVLASRLDGILVVDEAYIDYACNGDGMAASFIPKLIAHPNVLVCGHAAALRQRRGTEAAPRH